VQRRADDEGEQGTFGWSRRTIVISAIAFVLLLGAISIAAGAALEREGLPRLVERLRAIGDRWWAPLALIAAFVVVNLTGIPGTPLTLAAGVVWGWLAGCLWVMAAIMIGTAVPYFITRQRVPRLRRTIESSFGTLSERMRGHGLTNVALLRLVHVFPFAAISYAARLAGVKLRDYLVGTFIGTLPGVFIYTYLADAILRGLVSTREAALRIGVAAVLLVALIVVSRWLGRKVNG
jgi:uncharacterized membrane protein YdjX (TVP38/TMEM64 family)